MVCGQLMKKAPFLFMIFLLESEISLNSILKVFEKMSNSFPTYQGNQKMMKFNFAQNF